VAIIHAERDMTSPGWMSVLEKVVGRRPPSSLRPLALSAVVQLADRGTVRAGRVDLTGFEAAFAGLAAPSLSAKAEQGRHTVYHLSGPTPLWGPRRGSSPATFSDLPQSRAGSRAAFPPHVDYTSLRDDLARKLELAEARTDFTRQLAATRVPTLG
jgi:hypothetical protein